MHRTDKQNPDPALTCSCVVVWFAQVRYQVAGPPRPSPQPPLSRAAAVGVQRGAIAGRSRQQAPRMRIPMLPGGDNDVGSSQYKQGGRHNSAPTVRPPNRGVGGGEAGGGGGVWDGGGGGSSSSASTTADLLGGHQSHPSCLQLPPPQQNSRTTDGRSGGCQNGGGAVGTPMQQGLSDAKISPLGVRSQPSASVVETKRAKHDHGNNNHNTQPPPTPSP